MDRSTQAYMRSQSRMQVELRAYCQMETLSVATITRYRGLAACMCSGLNENDPSVPAT
jgi:hypothetical protein